MLVQQHACKQPWWTFSKSGEGTTHISRHRRRRPPLQHMVTSQSVYHTADHSVQQKKKKREDQGVVFHLNPSLELGEAWHPHWSKCSEELHQETPVVVQLSCTTWDQAIYLAIIFLNITLLINIIKAKAQPQHIEAHCCPVRRHASPPMHTGVHLVFYCAKKHPSFDTIHPTQVSPSVLRIPYFRDALGVPKKPPNYHIFQENQQRIFAMLFHLSKTPYSRTSIEH